jgi:hypothetical protein
MLNIENASINSQHLTINGLYRGVEAIEFRNPGFLESFWGAVEQKR